MKFSSSRTRGHRREGGGVGGALLLTQGQAQVRGSLEGPCPSLWTPDAWVKTQLLFMSHWPSQWAA